MKIRFVQNFSSATEQFHAGNDYDVDNADAIRYINDGIARKTPEPSTPDQTLNAAPSPLKPGESFGIDPTKPAAEPVPTDIPPAPADNPAAFMHPNGQAEPHTGFTTSDPGHSVSPPSDGKSPLASDHAPEAITKDGKPAVTANRTKPGKTTK